MTYAVELPAAGPEDWAAWSAGISARVRALGPKESVEVTIPSLIRPHEVRPSKFFGLIPASHEDTSPWVRVRREENHAVAELIGSEAFGGDFLLSPDEEERIAALGWRRPGNDSVEARIWTRWFPDDIAERAYLPLSDAQAAADLVTRTLRDVFLLAPV